ncbi:alpha/beta fold hydrolase [candidate division KSB1 bacterium]|nr:alpha/beta fold hydrolase [candidate division KSB1 bacterium]NIT71826.1 alpha/beta fold hydrolase [candidate division KSB1 bacterium]NIX71506.1 alpha/beta fold hydrolase [candidate division KSB1 bacterium]
MPTNNFYKNSPVGCLLVHGFTGSPNELLELGGFLARKNVTVSIPTLPGHGTYSGDLFNYTWKDWFACVKAAFHELEQNCKEMFVCGLSMGGTLALHLAAHKPVHGVISLAGAVEFPIWQKVGAKYLKNTIKFYKKRDREDVLDRAVKEQLDSYDRYPLYAVDQLFRMMDHVREDLSEISQPILIMHSRKDHTVDFSNSEVIYNSVSSADKRKIDLKDSYHVITVDVEKERVQNEVFRFLDDHSELLKARSSKEAGTKPHVN